MGTKRERKIEEYPREVILRLSEPERFTLLDYWYGNWGVCRPQWK